MKQIFSLLLVVVAALACSAARVDTVAIVTENMPSPLKVTVITPDKAAQEACPAVYVLNGYSGDHTSWLSMTRPDLPDLADRFGVFVVMPDGRDSWYWDSPIDPTMQMESFMTKDLVPYVDGHFNTLADPHHRAITGLSMGGHGALYLAMRHSDIWGSAGSMSGGVDIMPFPKSWKMAERLGPQQGNEQLWREHSVMSQVSRLAPGQLNITFDCGIDDFFAEVNENLHKALVEAKIPHDYASRPGRHTHQYWANSILYHLLYFSQIFNQ